jgi:hypothetical protein
MDERERRIGLNEAVFREVNERIREIGQTLQTTVEQLDLVCECGMADCTERIRMTQSEYEALRSNGRQFAIVPGHEIKDVEKVLERRESYDVVEKHPGPAAELAEETDPRS